MWKNTNRASQKWIWHSVSPIVVVFMSHSPIVVMFGYILNWFLENLATLERNWSISAERMLNHAHFETFRFQLALSNWNLAWFVVILQQSLVLNTYARLMGSLLFSYTMESTWYDIKFQFINVILYFGTFNLFPLSTYSASLWSVLLPPHCPKGSSWRTAWTQMFGRKHQLK